MCTLGAAGGLPPGSSARRILQKGKRKRKGFQKTEQQSSRKCQLAQKHNTHILCATAEPWNRMYLFEQRSLSYAWD